MSLPSVQDVILPSLHCPGSLLCPALACQLRPSSSSYSVALASVVLTKAASVDLPHLLLHQVALASVVLTKAASVDYLLRCQLTFPSLI